MPDTPRPLLDIETLGKPSDYPGRQLATACVVASKCHEVFGAVRFILLEAPREH